jgi:hypothetical protein
LNVIDEFTRMVTTTVNASDLGDLLHDACVELGRTRANADGVIIGGWLDHRAKAYRFDLSVSHAQLVEILDPTEMGWFDVYDCESSGERIRLWGDGPVGSVELAVTSGSEFVLARETMPFMVRRFGFWRLLK